MHTKPVTLFIPGKVLIQINPRYFMHLPCSKGWPPIVTLRSPGPFSYYLAPTILQTLLYLDLMNLMNTNFQQNSKHDEDENSLLQHQFQKSRGLYHPHIHCRFYSYKLANAITYIRNNRGPDIEPCGTPAVHGKISSVALQFLCTDVDLIDSFRTICFPFR